MANFALNYSFTRNLNIPLDEDAVKSTYAEVLSYVQTKSKCYAGQLFSVVEDGDNNGLYVAITTGADAVIIKLATQEALEAVAESAGKIDKIQLNGTDLVINDKTVNIDLSTYATTESVNEAIDGLSEIYAPKAEFEEVQKKVDDITSVGGEPNVQSDWNVVDETSDAFIKNKPDLAVYAVATAVTEEIADAVEEVKGYADDEIAKVATKVNTLIGEDAEKSARAIAAEEVAKVVANADGDFDTLKEISDWILNDTTGAANMANDIAALKEEDSKIDGRLDELEALKHNHSNKDVLDGITDVKVAAWDAAEQNAKDYADGLAVNYDAAGAAADAQAAAEAKAAELAGEAKTYAETKASEAQVAAEAYADGLAVNYDAAGAAADAQAAAEAKAAELAGEAKTYAETKASEAQVAAKAYADGLAVNYDAAGAAADALIVAKGYADGLAVNYDAAGAAENALTSAKAHVSTELAKLSDVYDAKGSAADAQAAAEAKAAELAGEAKTYAETKASEAQAAAEAYADGLAVNYDAAGAAVTAAGTALENAKIYTNEEIAKLSDVYDVKGAAASAETAAKTYTDEEIGKLSSVYAPKAEFEEVQKKVDDITSVGGEPNVQSDWNVADETSDAFIKNKPDLNVYAVATAVTEEIADAIVTAVDSAKTYTDGVVNGLSEVYASKATVETLVGTDTDKSVRTIAAEEVALVVDNAPEAFDTLREIAEWIADGSGVTASEIVTSIETLKNADDAIKGRLDSLEAISGQSHTHANKELLDTYTQTNDDLTDAVSKKHSHDNKDVLDGITDVKVAAWDAAEQNAKDYADGLAVNYDVAGAAASAETAAKAYADGLVENIKPYEGGVATSIEMGENETYVVDVKVSDNDKNFLNVNNYNELEVSGITLDAAVTSKEITIEGGQWATAVKTVFTGGTVPAGTTWESFLEAMLCVEKFVGSVNTSRSFTVSCGNINPGLDKTGTVEVGTKVTLGATTANATTASQSLTVSAFTYGYKIGEDGVRTTATAYTETLTPTKTKADDSLKITFTGFTTSVDGETVVETKTGNGSIAKVEMYAMDGTNKVVVAQTGDTYAASTAVTADTIYISTNLKNYYKSDKVTANTYDVTYPATSKTATDTTEYTVTGAHKYFIGDVVDSSYAYWDEDRSEAVQGFTTQDWATASTITKAHTFKVGTKQQTVVVPAKYTSVSGKDANQGDVTFNKVKTFDFTNKQGYVSSYSVFVAPSFDGLGVDSKITITIK